LTIPVRVTMTVSGDNILLTIGEKGASLKQFYLACIDRDLKPNTSWELVGNLEIDAKYRLQIRGIQNEGQH